MGDNSMRISEEPQDFHKEQVAKARRTIQEHRARSLGLKNSTNVSYMEAQKWRSGRYFSFSKGGDIQVPS